MPNQLNLYYREHAIELIDHVFFKNGEVTVVKDLDGYKLAPMDFADEKAALENLIPSSTMPSDHYPVLVSFEL